jgi:ATP-dependent Clp protease ATP-binding subunit ClpC
VIFNSLEQQHINQIIDIIMKDVMKRLATMGFTVSLSDEARKFLAEKGYDAEFGARPLHRAIQKYLEDPLAEEILSHRITEGDTLNATFDDKEQKITFQIESRAEKKLPEDSPEKE